MHSEGSLQCQCAISGGGGLAVNAHGVVRLTHDVDLVIQLVPESIRRAFDALLSIGYRPSVPVTAEQFSDEALHARAG